MQEVLVRGGVYCLWVRNRGNYDIEKYLITFKSNSPKVLLCLKSL